jgi:hypothetical protein
MWRWCWSPGPQLSMPVAPPRAASGRGAVGRCPGRALRRWCASWRLLRGLPCGKHRRQVFEQLQHLVDCSARLTAPDPSVMVPGPARQGQARAAAKACRSTMHPGRPSCENLAWRMRTLPRRGCSPARQRLSRWPPARQRRSRARGRARGRTRQRGARGSPGDRLRAPGAARGKQPLSASHSAPPTPLPGPGQSGSVSAASSSRCSRCSNSTSRCARDVAGAAIRTGVAAHIPEDEWTSCASAKRRICWPFVIHVASLSRIGDNANRKSEPAGCLQPRDGALATPAEETANMANHETTTAAIGAGAR